MRMPDRLTILCLTLALSLFASGCDRPAETPDNVPMAERIEIREAWIRAAPPGASATAAYMSLTNTSESDAELVGGETPSFERIELHATEIREGMARMVPQEAIRVGAGQTVDLAPGALHLMLMQPQGSVSEGVSVPLTLRFADASERQVAVTVRRGPPDGEAPRNGSADAAMEGDMTHDMDGRMDHDNGGS